MDYNLNKEISEKKYWINKWFESSSSGRNKDIYLTYLIILLIISYCATVFVAVK